MNSSDNPAQRNAATQKKQWLLIGSVVTVLLCLGLGGMYLFDTSVEQTVRASDKPATVAIAKPGGVDDAASWRATQATRLKEIDEAQRALDQTTKALTAKDEARDKQFEALRSEMEKLQRALELAQRSVGTSVPGNTSGSPAMGPMNRPLPMNPATQNANARVLEPPGRPPLGGGMQTPLPGTPGAQDSAMIASGPRLEIITFASADKTPDSPTSPTRPNPVAPPGAAPGLAPVVASAPAPNKPKGDFIPANTFAKASLLNGVDAPTGGQAQGQGFAGNPHPLHLHITSLANLPNLRKANLTDCRIMAAATGDISNERVYGRFETISCVLPSGQAIEMPAKGHLIGEDGKYGIRGTLVSKAGQVIAAQILAEFARGIGNGFRQAATIQSTTAFGVTQIPDNSRIGQAAIGSGIAGGANALATYYTNLSNKLFPVIEVAAGREVEVVFSQGVQMPGALDGPTSTLASQQSHARGAIHDQE